MIILKRQVIATKSVDDVGRVLMSCAYHFPKAIFKASSFSMHCAKRHNGGYLSLIKITGNVLTNEETTKVILEVHANLYFFIGCLIAVLGISGLLYCFFSSTDRWIPFLGMCFLGLLVGGQSLWEGSEILDHIEHKLMR